MRRNLQETVDLLTLTEEILNGKLDFLCSLFFQIFSRYLILQVSFHDQLLCRGIVRQKCVWLYFQPVTLPEACKITTLRHAVHLAKNEVLKIGFLQ